MFFILIGNLILPKILRETYIGFLVNEFSAKSFLKTFVSEIGVFLRPRNFIDRNALLTIMRPSKTSPSKDLPNNELN